jgi:hypothetical protein
MTSLVLPTDNAVIDYSIIAQIVAAINDIQAQVIANKPPTIKDSTTGLTIVPKTIGKVFAQGSPQFPTGSGTTITINATDMGLVSMTAITASIYNGADGRYVWLSAFNAAQAKFTISGKGLSNASIHVIAYGT